MEEFFMFEKFRDLGLFAQHNAEQPPYSDEEIRDNIEVIKRSIKSHADMILKYEIVLSDEDFLVNNVRIVEIKDLKPFEAEAFENYEALKKNQQSFQARLKDFESYLSLRAW